jgi:hypothetical protein
VDVINCSEFYKRQEEFLSGLREVSTLLTEQKDTMFLINVISHEPEYFMNNMIICFEYFYMC